ncbi:antitoxin [Candidatus Pacearchaeota archaeon]|nr:antitoxin [Candidatus Pacearchaeota archaeon]
MTKIISISDEAYEELKKLKKDGSFSRIILELSREKKKNSIMDFAGIIDKEEGERMLKQLIEEKKIGSRRFQ